MTTMTEDEFESRVREIAGEEAADKAKDAVEQAEKSKEEMTSDEQKALLQQFKNGNVQPKTPKEMRDGSPLYGDRDRNLKRAEEGKEYKTNKFARTIALVASHQAKTGTSANMWPKVAEKAREKGWDDIAEPVEKDLESGELDAGGAFVSTTLSEDFIEILYDEAVVRGFGPNTLNLDGNSSVRIPKMTQSATARYVGEAQGTDASQQNTGELVLEPKKLMAQIIMSNDLLREEIDGASQMFEQDLRTVAANREDLAFIRGNSPAEPKGIRFSTDSSHVTTATATPSADTLFQELVKTKGKLGQANVPESNPGWLMPQKAVDFIWGKLGTQETYDGIVTAFLQGNLLGEPYAVSNQIPTDLTGSNDKTEVYYADFDQVVIADQLNVQVRSTSEATVTDSNSNDYKTFDRDARAVQVIHKSDIGLRHTKGASILDEFDANL